MQRPDPPTARGGNSSAWRLLALSLGLLLLAGGCPSEAESFDFSLLLVRETECEKGPRTQTQLGSQHAIRLSFVRRPESKPIGAANLRELELICDQAVVPGSDVEFTVDTSDSGPVLGVRVEVFDRQRQLVSFGENLALDIWQPEGTVYLRPAGKPSCVEPARRLHAFHSATLLPNGQVLLVGGLVADVAGGDNLAQKAEAFANGDVEIYDPAGIKFLVTDPVTIPGRAFHRAVLLPSPVAGPYKVLLVGGLAPAGETSPLVRLRATDTTFFVPFLVSPHETAVAAEAALLTITPDPTSPKIAYTPLPDLPRGMFPALLPTPDGQEALFIPGAGEYQATATDVTGFTAGAGGITPEARWIRLTDPPVVGDAVPMERIRVGHAAARLGPDRFVAVGGAMDGTEGTEADNVAAAVTRGLGVRFANVTPAGTTPLAWHTLTPIGRTDRQAVLDPPRAALLAGGLELKWDGSPQYRFAVGFAAGQPSLQLVQDGTPLAITDQSAAGGYTVTSHHAAVRLHDGRVMVTGGNTAGERPDADPYEASAQIAIYRLEGNALQLDASSDTQTLQVARFGHRATRLLDNSILITGGITLRTGGIPVVTTEAELLAPRTGATSEDFPFDRPPGEASLPCPLYGGGEASTGQTPATPDAGSAARALSSQPTVRLPWLGRPGPRVHAVRDAARRLTVRVSAFVTLSAHGR